MHQDVAQDVAGNYAAGATMPRFTDHDFANYRNLARRAENTNDRADELRYLEKCIEIYEFRKGVDCNVDTFTDVVSRINFLRNARARSNNV